MSIKYLISSWDKKTTFWVTVPDTQPLKSPSLTYLGLPADSVNGTPSFLEYCEKWIDGHIDGKDLLSGAIALLARANNDMKKIARVAATLFLSLDRDPNSLIPFNPDTVGSSTGSAAFKAATKDLLNISMNVEETTGDTLSENVGIHLCFNATRATYGTLLLEYGQSTARREKIISTIRKGCANLVASGVPSEVVFGGANGDLICSAISAILDLALAEHPAAKRICTEAWRCIPLDDALLYRCGTGAGIGWGRHLEYTSRGSANECDNHIWDFGLLIAALDTSDIEKDSGSTFDNIPAAYPDFNFQTRAHQLAKEGSCASVTISFLGALLWQYFAHSHSGNTPRNLLKSFLRALNPATVTDGVSSRRATVDLLDKGELPGYTGPLGMPSTLEVGSLTYIWDQERLYYRPDDYISPAYSNCFVDGWEDRLKTALARFDLDERSHSRVE